MQTPTTTPDTCPDFAWCVTDHTVSPGLHIQAAATVSDLYGIPLAIELFHDQRTGRTGVAVGGHEVSLAAAFHIARLLNNAAAVGVDLPGAFTADLVAGGAR